MPKKNEKVKKPKKIETSSETTGTEPTLTISADTVTSTNDVAEIKKIDKLEIGFPNEDMNKVVGKINELIDKTNDSI